MYSAITDVTGANTVIDSSKGAGYGWILPSVPGIRLSVINLVRDSRAVTNSWINHRPWNSRPFYLSTPSFSAMHWDLEHALAESLRLRADAYIRIRYEDFARAPRDALQRIARALAIEVPPVSDEGVVQQTDAHQVAGNRTRHSSGPVAIREDELWKQELGLVDAVKVTALTWPLLLRHGYSITYRKPNT